MEQSINFKHICKEDTYMFNYTQLPDELFTVQLFAGLSLHAKVLYSFMLRRVSLSKENSWIDDSGDVYIYYKVDEIMEKFNCSNKTAAKIMADLVEIGLIEKKRQGQGMPDIIYVNKFSVLCEEAEENDEGEEPTEPDPFVDPYASKTEDYQGGNGQNSEVKNLHIKKCKNYTSRSVKNTSQEVKNLHPNYKENNYKETINNSSSASQPKRISEEQVRLMEEEEEEYKRKIGYYEAERLYTVHIAGIAFAELLKRKNSYREQFTEAMFLRVCKTIKSSREPIVSLPGLVNWCYDNIQKQEDKAQRQFNQFMRTDYDFSALEKEIVSN